MQALSFLLTYFLALGPFFCSTAPQAFFRPDRRFPTPSRAEAVKAGRRSAMAAHSVVSRPRLDSFEHGGRLDGLGPEERSVVECGPPLSFARGDCCCCQVHRSLRGPGSLAAPWPQGFDAAMSRTHSTRG